MHIVHYYNITNGYQNVLYCLLIILLLKYFIADNTIIFHFSLLLFFSVSVNYLTRQYFNIVLKPNYSNWRSLQYFQYTSPFTR